MSKKYYIEVDASPWLGSKGVNVCVFLGDTCDPIFDQTLSYEELIDKELHAHTVHGKLTNKHRCDNIGSAEELVLALEQAAVYARKRFEELKDE